MFCSTSFTIFSPPVCYINKKAPAKIYILHILYTCVYISLTSARQLSY
nr:MAG TPA: hypothetical protein [Bacteriophage sp.]